MKCLSSIKPKVDIIQFSGNFEASRDLNHSLHACLLLYYAFDDFCLNKNKCCVYWFINAVFPHKPAICGRSYPTLGLNLTGLV